MSLDIYVTINEPVEKTGTGVFVRRNGANVELSIEEVREMYPDSNIEEKSYESFEVGYFNITHNLTTMADKAGLYEIMWHPTTTVARDFIEPLATGLTRLLNEPEYFKEFNPENGWGTYEYLVEVVSELLILCTKYPEGEVSSHG
jgi:hypothetical protein